MKKSALICVTYNNFDILFKCLTSIYTYTTQPYHLFLIDNGSRDKTLGLYGTSLKNTTIIRNNENKWWAGGINQGLKLCCNEEFEYIFFLNDDIEVYKNWIENFQERLKDERIGAVGPLNSSLRDWQGYSNVKRRMLNDLPNISNIDPLDIAKINKTISTFSPRHIIVKGMLAFFAVGFRRKIFEKLGFLDDDFEDLMAGDDDEFCARLENNGLNLCLLTNTYIIHHAGMSIQKLDNELTKSRRKKAIELLHSKYPHRYTRGF